MLTTIIFDCDGVVMDSEPLWDMEMTEFLAERGLIYDRNRVKHKTSGKSLKEVVEVLREAYGLEGDNETMAKERLERMSRLLRTKVKFMPGFSDFFLNVSGKYKTCIATACHPVLFKAADTRLKMTGLFNGNIFFTHALCSKPAPDVFLLAAERMNSKPSECVVIEDSPMGIKAAKAAGMKCIGITTTYDKKLLEDADIIVDSFNEIDLKPL